MYKLKDKEIQEQGNDEANSPLRNKSNANTQNTLNPNLEGKIQQLQDRVIHQETFSWQILRVQTEPP